MKQAILLFLLLQTTIIAQAQKNQAEVAAVGFYNFENLFDTIDTPDVNDAEFTATGKRHWVPAIYQDKLHNLAKVVSELATDVTPDGVAILGVSEIENRSVLEDFVKQPAVAGRNYQIVHYDSPDRRGIDVGLLYQPKYFTVLGSKSIPLHIYDDKGDTVFTRDILYVSGLLKGDTMHILVNHWPSRSGGEKRSRPFRNAAALQCKMVKDSLVLLNPKAKVIIMGDLNDDPSSPSVAEILDCKAKEKDVRKGGMLNPWYDFFKNGIGTLAYQDAWSLFDQILISDGLVGERESGFRYYKAQVYNKPYLIQKTGQYKGYPFRTFDFDNYVGGYSDHFPVYLFLVREIKVANP